MSALEYCIYYRHQLIFNSLSVEHISLEDIALFLFQIIGFIIEMLFIIFVGCVFIFIFYTNPWFTKKKKNSYRVTTFSKREDIKQNFMKRLPRIISTIIFASATLYLLMPYILDIPTLVTGDFYYAYGSAYRIKSSAPYEYVHINNREVKFFFSSNIKDHERYKIGYLANTHRAIYGVSLGQPFTETSMKTAKRITFPLKDILLFLGIMAIIVIMILVAPYIRYKSIIAVSVFYYPISIFQYIKDGLTSSLWLSFSNKGLVLLAVGMGLSLFTFLARKVESRVSENQLFRLMFAVQGFAACKILVLFAVLLDK